MRERVGCGSVVFGGRDHHADRREVAVGVDHPVLERFVAIGETEDQAERNMGRLVQSFGQFLSLYTAGGRRAVPETDGEFQVDSAAASKNRPAIAVSGTPDQIVSALQQAIDETGARRLLVETFSREEARLFAREVIPVLKQRNAIVG